MKKTLFMFALLGALLCGISTAFAVEGRQPSAVIVEPSSGTISVLPTIHVKIREGVVFQMVQIKDDDGQILPIDVSFPNLLEGEDNASIREVSVKPTYELPADSNFVVEVTVSTLQGVTTQVFKSAFTTGKDVLGPVVTSTNFDGKEKVYVGQDIFINLSEPMETANVKIKNATGMVMPVKVLVIGALIEIPTVDNLAPGKYSVVIPTGSKDLNGNVSEKEYSGVFEIIQDITPPEVNITLSPGKVSAFAFDIESGVKEMLYRIDDCDTTYAIPSEEIQLTVPADGGLHAVYIWATNGSSKSQMYKVIVPAAVQ